MLMKLQESLRDPLLLWGMLTEMGMTISFPENIFIEIPEEI